MSKIVLPIAMASFISIGASFSDTPDQTIVGGRISDYEAMLDPEPAMPACGNYITENTWGPVTNATTWMFHCSHETNGVQSYKANEHYKTKKIYQYGNLWFCFDVETPGIVCHSYYREPCPDSTCVGTGP